MTSDTETLAAKQHKRSTFSLVKRIARDYLNPYWGQIGLAFVFMLIAAAMTAGFAKLLEPVVDNVLVETNRHLIVPMAGAVFLCFFIRGLATYIHTILMNRAGQAMVMDIQNDLFANFIDLDLSFFQQNPSGQLVSRVMNDVEVVRMAVAGSFVGVGKSLLTLVLLVALMFYQDWKLSLIAFIFFPFAATFVAIIGRRLRKLSGNLQDHKARLTDVLTQIFQGIRQVKAYGMESFERNRAGTAIDTVRKLNVKSVQLGTLSTPFNETLIGLAVTGVIVYGGMQVLNGALTTGSLISFIAAFALAYEPMKKLATLNNTLQMGMGAADRVFDMMDRRAEIQDSPGALTLASAKPSIVFESVSFGYDEDEIMALNDVSLTMEPGKITALVGPSGSGKTTIMNMIPRFYDPLSGRVMIDGQDIRNVTLSSLRGHIALVSQDITIFNDTVRANIAYGNQDASDEQIREAAKAAFAHDFIMAMPEGYDSILGEQGTKLSGGQRQRISIARAVLKNAPILLLDEATSALDNESERAIQATLAELQKGRTSLVIAHRLSTVQAADQIIVLDKGKIIEQGRHEELLEKAGLYARMYQTGLQ
ncbi:MAG: ABC transporter ATP-binding protein [Rhodospirillales bacterium]|nr:ABC transporter ATP-binding protein [Rhodospirillales bacterium]